MANLVFSIFLVLCVLVIKSEARNRPPLITDDNNRMRNKAADLPLAIGEIYPESEMELQSECVFGNEVRELGSQWIPNLGVPFGILYCMKCECVPRKRRVVAKVQCRNIQKECPEPTCSEPVLKKGRCCKTCPGDTNNPDNIQDIDIIPQHSLDDDEKTTKHYAALLTGRSSLVLKNDYLRLSPNERNRNKIIATGRFTFHKKNLHYSFIFSDRAQRPRSLQFIDNEGNILEEFTLLAQGAPLGFYQKTTRKVCGSWKRIPRPYRRLMKQEKMYVALVWGTKDFTEFTISGLITKYNLLSKEMFSSLMEPAANSDPDVMNGSGGTAFISVSTAINPSIYISVIFNGLFGIDQIADVPLNITLYLDKKKIVQKQVIVKKPSNELNLVETSAILENQEMRALTRGKLGIGIHSVKNPVNMRLYGHIVSKASCEIFQTLLASNSEHGLTGMGWFYMTNEGNLNYNVQVDNLKTEIPNSVTLTDLTTKRRTELEDLTPYFEGGWANGTIDRISPKFLEPFYSGNIGINISIEKTSTVVKGKLVSKLVADARNSKAPILLKRENYTLPPTAVGLAWISVDHDCHIHYDISLSGLGFNNRKLDLILELLPMLAPGAPVIRKHLDSFIGNQVENSPVEGLSKEELGRLDTGVGIIKIMEDKSILLSATVTQLQVPFGCRPPYNADNNVPPLLFDKNDDPPSIDCFYEGKFYQEEAQWTSSRDPCTMCFCQNGKEKCDTMTCPEPDCDERLRVKAPGECCPSCPSKSFLPETQSRRNLPHTCLFNGKHHTKGSKFHPFLIPTGFDTCTECVCDPVFMEIKCVRNRNERSCCKNCSRQDFDVNESYPADEMPVRNPNLGRKQEKTTKSADQIMKEGGCRNLNNPHKPHENGSEYFPYIDSLGFYKCVTCKCNRGNQTCKRNPCDKAACEKMFKARKNKKLQTGEHCCSVKDCRRFKHKKNHRSTVPTS
ncbi:dorsal-ventral patterning protein Sog isoform X2 [Harmonia axyridis]|uniref:dorsal-ventral patterning protein Sog isoform X2 n=2 Tax=Harmonia axyridis TaxID=115357 RepID=UPI001E279A1C|nr:dorsal-ventral patterning protein Sog isoform X2 [Harmonia axyridis]